MNVKLARIVAISVLAALALVPAGTQLARLTASAAGTTVPPAPAQGASQGAGAVPAAYALAPTGEVYWSQAGGPWRPLHDGQLLGPGDKVRVDARGGVSVMFAGGTVVRLDTDTTVEIRAVNARGWDKSGDKSRQWTAPAAERSLAARVYQSAGRVWVHVLRRVNSVLNFEVETPAAVAGVRGTIFAVTVSSPGVTTVSVWEGVVEVTPAPAAGPTPGGPVRVAAKQAVRVEKGKKPTLFQQLTPDEDDRWRQAAPWLQGEEERSRNAGAEDAEEGYDSEGYGAGKGDEGKAGDKKAPTQGEEEKPGSGGGSGGENGAREASDDEVDDSGHGDSSHKDLGDHDSDNAGSYASRR